MSRALTIRAIVFARRAARPPQEFMTNPSWKTAVTYADAPHEYVLRPDCPETFRLYQDRLRKAGVTEKFTLRGRTATYRYYYGNDGYKYWIIGRVLNRAASASRAVSLPEGA
jgi:hypothetical protein